MEIIRQKAVETRIAFPLITSAGSDYFSSTVWGSLTSATAYIMSWQDSQDITSAALINSPVEIADTGIWSITCTSAEMNPDSGADEYVLIKFNAEEIQEQTILIHLVDYQLRTVFDINNRINGVAGTKNTLDDLNDITSAAAYDASISANENLATTAQLAASANAIIAEIDVNEIKIDTITADTNYLTTNTISANIVEVQGDAVQLSAFKNTTTELYTQSFSAIDVAIDSKDVALGTDVVTAHDSIIAQGNEYWAASASVDETSAGCVLAIQDQFSFSGNNVNVFVSDKTNFNDITVAEILSGGIDNTTLQEAMEKLLSFCIGKIDVDGNTLRYFYQDNSTSAFALSGDNSGRIQI